MPLSPSASIASAPATSDRNTDANTGADDLASTMVLHTDRAARSCLRLMVSIGSLHRTPGRRPGPCGVDLRGGSPRPLVIRAPDLGVQELPRLPLQVLPRPGRPPRPLVRGPRDRVHDVGARPPGLRVPRAHERR